MSEVEENQVDQNHLGAILKNAREELGLTEEFITHEHRFPVGFLQALESNDFESLPGDTYTRAYIKSLAEEYKLDVEELLDLYYQSKNRTREPIPQNTISFDTSGNSLQSLEKKKPVKMILVMLICSITLMIISFMSKPDEDLDQNSSNTPVVSDSIRTSLQDSQFLAKDSLLMDSLDKVTETNHSIGQYIDSLENENRSSEDSLEEPHETSEIPTNVKISILKDSTWFLIQSKNAKDTARWIRAHQGEMAFQRNDTVTLEFGSIRDIVLKSNDTLITPKSNRFQILGAEIVGNQ